MKSRRMTVVVGGVMIVGVALWLVWLAGGTPPIDVAARDAIDPTHGPRVDTSLDNAVAQADTLRAHPYEDVVPSTEPADSSDAHSASRSPTSAPSRGETPRAPGSAASTALPGPLVDTSVAAVVASLEDRHLAIPVKGVRAADLVDTYASARSEGRTHNAIDIIAPAGTPVVAVATGTVLKLFYSERGGVTLYQLDPDGRTVYYYAHLQSYAPGIVEGKALRQGELIGYVGDTGNAIPGNTHLHFEITIVESPSRYWTGVPVNPYPLLVKR